ncbi:MAG: hypothetical protein QW220_04980 [Candidatus Bathyarchaeia archaeon]
MKRSARCSATAPNAIPRTATHMPPRPIAGTRRLKNVAASITLAENPSIISKILSETFLVNKTGNAPTPLANPARKLAAEPSQMASKSIPNT